MIKIVLSNGFFYIGEVLEEDKDFLVFKDQLNKVMRIRKKNIIMREMEVLQTKLVDVFEKDDN